MRPLALAALLAVAPILQAASPQTTPNQPVSVIMVDPLSGTCPVAFSARRQSIAERVAIGDAGLRRRSGQGVALSLGHPTSAIRSAEVVVHAASDKLRALQLESRTDPSAPDLSRPFHLSGPSSGSLRNTFLWLEGAGSILSVDLLSITYADGTTWNHNPAAICRAIPSGYLLVSSR